MLDEHTLLVELRRIRGLLDRLIRRTTPVEPLSLQEQIGVLESVLGCGPSDTEFKK